jgi:hypothetical protein
VTTAVEPVSGAYLAAAMGGGKQTGKPLHSGTLGEGMRAAIEAMKRGHCEGIEGWERQ